MRIALFHNLPGGGAKRAVSEWTRRLARTHAVDVYTLDIADHGFCDLRPYVRLHREYPFCRHGLFSSPLGRLNQLQRWRELRRANRLARRIAADIDRQPYDVVFVHPCLLTTIPTVLQHLRSRTVYYLHEAIGRAAVGALPPTPRGPLRGAVDNVDPLVHLYRRTLRHLQESSLRSTRTLLANSRFTQGRMQAAYGRDSIVCYCGVDADQFQPLATVRQSAHVLSVGELSPRKGFTFLVDALSRIPARQRPALRLVCNAVIDEERGRVERLAAERGVNLQIRVGLDSATLATEYNAAAVCVYAPVGEPFGLVPIEAMACGRPVVGVREGGVAESVVNGRTGILVRRDPTEFAEAVLSVLTRPSLATELGRQGREHVLSTWTWDQSTARIERALFETHGPRTAQ